jgi:Mg-chelatase subunit ChlI
MCSGLSNIITVTITVIVIFNATVSDVHTDVDIFTESSFILAAAVAIPVQACTGPEGSRRLRPPGFLGNWHMNVALAIAVRRRRRRRRRHDDDEEEGGGGGGGGGGGEEEDEEEGGGEEEEDEEYDEEDDDEEEEDEEEEDDEEEKEDTWKTRHEGSTENNHIRHRVHTSESINIKVQKVYCGK